MKKEKQIIYISTMIYEDGHVSKPLGCYRSIHWARSHWDKELTWEHYRTITGDEWLAPKADWPKPLIYQVEVLD